MNMENLIEANRLLKEKNIKQEEVLKFWIKEHSKLESEDSIFKRFFLKMFIWKFRFWRNKENK